MSARTIQGLLVAAGVSLGLLGAAAWAQIPTVETGTTAPERDVSVPRVEPPTVCDPGEVDDRIECTVDTCDPSTGTITHTPDHRRCDDANVCTANVCAAAGCRFDPLPIDQLDDGNACTEDLCDPREGIVHRPTVIDDHNVCTVDSCDSAEGVRHAWIDARIGTPCFEGIGGCYNEGQWACDDKTGEIACTAKAGSPSEEVCNTIDDNCDGVVDNVARLGETCTDGKEECLVTGALECKPDGRLACSVTAGDGTDEVCDGIDNDCDGQIDESLAQGCYDGPSYAVGVGICREGRQSCEGGEWSACRGSVLPSAGEICGNALDDNCDGRVDEGCQAATAEAGEEIQEVKETATFRTARTKTVGGGGDETEVRTVFDEEVVIDRTSETGVTKDVPADTAAKIKTTVQTEVKETAPVEKTAEVFYPAVIIQPTTKTTATTTTTKTTTTATTTKEPEPAKETTITKESEPTKETTATKETTETKTTETKTAETKEVPYSKEETTAASKAAEEPSDVLTILIAEEEKPEEEATEDSKETEETEAQKGQETLVVTVRIAEGLTQEEPKEEAGKEESDGQKQEASPELSSTEIKEEGLPEEKTPLKTTVDEKEGEGTGESAEGKGLTTEDQKEGGTEVKEEEGQDITVEFVCPEGKSCDVEDAVLVTNKIDVSESCRKLDAGKTVVEVERACLTSPDEKLGVEVVSESKPPMKDVVSLAKKIDEPEGGGKDSGKEDEVSSPDIHHLVFDPSLLPPDGVLFNTDESGEAPKWGVVGGGCSLILK